MEDFGGELEIDRVAAFIRSLTLAAFAPWFLRLELELGAWSHWPRTRKR